MSGVEPVMRDGRQWIWHRRDAVRIRSGTEGRLASGPAIELPPHCGDQGPIVFRRELHEQIVRMLSIVNGFALADLAGGKQIGVAAARNRQRLQAEHRVEAEAAAANLAHGHSHHPVDAACLLASSLSGLVKELHEPVAMPHELPRPELLVQPVHRRDIRQPGGARGVSRGKQRRRSRTVARVLGVVLLRRRLVFMLLVTCRR